MTPVAVNLSDASAVVDVLTAATEVLLSNADRRGSSQHLPGSGRVLVTGDLHDNLFHFQKIIHLARLDEGTDRHLVLQELIHGDRLVDGIDLSHRMLGRVAAMVAAFPGQVHPMLANHELAQATGKSVSKGRGDSVRMFIDGVDWAFGDRGDDVLEAIICFILAMPLAVRSERGLCCSHSLPAAGMMHVFDNTIVDRDFEPADLQGNDGSAYLMTWGRQHTEDQLASIADRWGVRLFCIGHAWVKDGIDAPMKNLVRLNSDHERGAVLPIDLSNIPTADDALSAVIRLSALPEVSDG